MGELIKSQELCLSIKTYLRDRIRYSGIQPKLKIYCLDEDPASKIYVGAKERVSQEVGIRCEVIKIDRQANLRKLLDQDNVDPNVHGILVQKPTVEWFEDEWISPLKDVDGFHPINAGYLYLNDSRAICPCTPKGVMTWLKRLEEVKGKHAVIIGRSAIVGRPMASLCLQEKMAVTMLNKDSLNNAQIASQGDVLIVATGVKNLIDETYVKEGAIVIDVGINRDENNKIVGDVNVAKVLPKVKYLSAVPGGVGPLTVTMLCWNMCRLAGIHLDNIENVLNAENIGAGKN